MAFAVGGSLLDSFFCRELLASIFYITIYDHNWFLPNDKLKIYKVIIQQFTLVSVPAAQSNVKKPYVIFTQTMTKITNC